MTLVVEDGTGLAAAEVFGSLNDVTNFQIGRSDYDTWIGASIDQQEAAAREATDYLEGTYTWRGTVRTTTQGLSWPRTNVVDDEGRSIASDSVPRAVVHAFAFLSGKAIARNLEPEHAGAPIQSLSVGPSGVSKSFGSVGNTPKRDWPELRTLLRGLYTDAAGSNSGHLVRWS